MARTLTDPDYRTRLVANYPAAVMRLRQRKAAGLYAPPADLDAARASFRSFLSRWEFSSREGSGRHNLGAALWPSQDQVIRLIDDQHVHRLCTLKGGKLGVTEIHVPLLAWIGLTQTDSDARIHFFSGTGDDASSLLDMLRVGIWALPRAWGYRVAAEERYGDTTRSLKVRCPDGGIRSFWSYAPRKTASISESAVVVMIDELAHMQFGRDVYNSVVTTVPDAGWLFVLSRGHGADNQMADLWLTLVGEDLGMATYEAAHARSLARVTDDPRVMVPLFQPYTMRPGRDEAWRLGQSETMTPAGLRWYAPETPQDAMAGDVDTEFVAVEQWDALEEIGPMIDGDRTPMVIALDAGIRSDHFALVAGTRHPDRHDEVAIRYVREWIPNPRVDFDEVRAEIRALAARHNVVCVTYDPYQLEDMAQEMGRESYWETFEQGKRRLLADKALRDVITQRRLARPPRDSDANRVLRASVQSAGIKTGAEDGTLRIVKRAAGKIDALVALAMMSAVCKELNL